MLRISEDNEKQENSENIFDMIAESGNANKGKIMVKKIMEVRVKQLKMQTKNKVCDGKRIIYERSELNKHEMELLYLHKLLIQNLKDESSVFQKLVTNCTDTLSYFLDSNLIPQVNPLSNRVDKILVDLHPFSDDLSHELLIVDILYAAGEFTR